MASPFIDLEVTLGSRFSICYEANSVRSTLDLQRSLSSSASFFLSSRPTLSQPISHDTRVEAYADNFRIRSTVLKSKPGQTLTHTVSSKREGISLYPLSFANLDLTDDEDLCSMDDAFLLKLVSVHSSP